MIFENMDKISQENNSENRVVKSNTALKNTEARSCRGLHKALKERWKVQSQKKNWNIWKNRMKKMKIIPNFIIQRCQFQYLDLLLFFPMHVITFFKQKLDHFLCKIWNSVWIFQHLLNRHSLSTYHVLGVGQNDKLETF